MILRLSSLSEMPRDQWCIVAVAGARASAQSVQRDTTLRLVETERNGKKQGLRKPASAEVLTEVVHNPSAKMHTICFITQVCVLKSDQRNIVGRAKLKITGSFIYQNGLRTYRYVTVTATVTVPNQ